LADCLAFLREHHSDLAVVARTWPTPPEATFKLRLRGFREELSQYAAQIARSVNYASAGIWAGCRGSCWTERSICAAKLRRRC